MFNRILVPIDGSDFSLRALRYSGQLAKEYGATLVLLSVVHAPSAMTTGPISRDQWQSYVEETGNQVLVSAIASLKEMGVEPEKTIIEMGDPAEVILMPEMTEGFDLVVMGKRGMGRLQGMLMGSVSSKVASHLATPLLLVP